MKDLGLLSMNMKNTLKQQLTQKGNPVS